MRGPGAHQPVLRWGDSETIKLVSSGGITSGLGTQTRQLVQGHWKWPITWNVQLIAIPKFGGDETGTVFVQWPITIGVGQAQTTILYPLSSTSLPSATPANGLYAEGMFWATPSALQVFGFASYTPLVAEFNISAENIQINAQEFNGVLTTASTDYMELAAYIAPITEPHVLEAMLEEMGPEAAVRHAHALAQGPQPAPQRWMQQYGQPSHTHPGTGIAFPIHPDPLTYEPR